MGGGGDSRRWRLGWVGLVVDAIVDAGVDAGHERSWVMHCCRRPCRCMWTSWMSMALRRRVWVVPWVCVVSAHLVLLTSVMSSTVDLSCSTDLEEFWSVVITNHNTSKFFLKILPSLWRTGQVACINNNGRDRWVAPITNTLVISAVDIQWLWQVSIPHHPSSSLTPDDNSLPISPSVSNDTMHNHDPSPSVDESGPPPPSPSKFFLLLYTHSILTTTATPPPTVPPARMTSTTSTTHLPKCRRQLYAWSQKLLEHFTNEQWNLQILVSPPVLSHLKVTSPVVRQTGDIWSHSPHQWDITNLYPTGYLYYRWSNLLGGWALLLWCTSRYQAVSRVGSATQM